MIQQFLDCGTIIATVDKVIIGWGERHHSSHPIDGKPNFYFPDFFLTQPDPWFTHENTLRLPLSEFLAQLPPTHKIEKWDWKTTHEPLFMQEMNHLQEQFSQGILQKAVPYAFLKAPQTFTTNNILSCLHSGLGSNGYFYGFWNNSEGMIGVTPEILFECSDRKVTTMAVAGTSSTKIPPEQLLNDSKTRHEHQLVVQGISEALSPYGKVLTAPCRTLQMRHLAHLATPIELMTTTPISFETLVHQLHPTPALGAYPKEPGKYWLQEYAKKIPRRRYGAPAGVTLSPSEFICLVAIRNVQWTAAEAFIGAGCGVVAQSDKRDEWHEIEFKWNSIKHTLAL